jgi:hypothetical protein
MLGGPAHGFYYMIEVTHVCVLFFTRIPTLCVCVCVVLLGVGIQARGAYGSSRVTPWLEHGKQREGEGACCRWRATMGLTTLG